MHSRFAVLFLFLALTACGSTPPPSDTSNACKIFKEHKRWYRAMKRAERKWGMPVHIQLAIVNQESSFIQKAKPPRTKILFFIPGPRQSSAYGYAQVKDETWEWYKKKSGNGWASRTDFSDAVDFVSWYGRQTQKRAGVSMWDPYNQYLAYHEGQGGFMRGTHNSKEWLLNTASRVDAKAREYGAQLKTCEHKFRRRFLIF